MYVENKVNAVLETFLGFAGVSSFLKFKLSVWKKSCAINFELKMLKTSLTPFWRLESFNGLYNYWAC